MRKKIVNEIIETLIEKKPTQEEIVKLFIKNQISQEELTTIMKALRKMVA